MRKIIVWDLKKKKREIWNLTVIIANMCAGYNEMLVRWTKAPCPSNGTASHWTTLSSEIKQQAYKTEDISVNSNVPSNSRSTKLQQSILNYTPSPSLSWIDFIESIHILIILQTVWDFVYSNLSPNHWLLILSEKTHIYGYGVAGIKRTFYHHFNLPFAWEHIL